MSNKSAYGRVHSAKNFILVVGCDGVARLFDIRGALGTGSLCGTVLRSRIPRASSGAASVQPSAVHMRTANTYTDSQHHQALGAAAGHAHTHPVPGTTTAAAVSNASSPRASHFMTHPTDRRSSLAQAAAPASGPAGSGPAAQNISIDSNDASCGFDFIIHDSTDDQDASHPGKRRASFSSRSVSAGRSGAGAGSSGTFGTFTSTKKSASMILCCIKHSAYCQRRLSSFEIRLCFNALLVLHAFYIPVIVVRTPLFLNFPSGGNNTNTRATSVTTTRSVSGASERSSRGAGGGEGKVLQSFVATHRSRKKEGADTAHLPLFELAALTPRESQVNTRKLRNFLELNGICNGVLFFFAVFFAAWFFFFIFILCLGSDVMLLNT